MSSCAAPQPFGGHSSNRYDGPCGTRGVKIVDVPLDLDELEVDLDAFANSPANISRSSL